MGRQIGERLTVETWEELLKIVLGISDFLLKGGRGAVDATSNLGSRLCGNLLKLLFELFFRSRTKNNEIWIALRDLLQGWRHRKLTK